MLVAGGGFKGGLAYGATDELGFQAVENRVHVNDLHATVLHQLGLDHEKLTFRYGGRDFRLTGIPGWKGCQGHCQLNSQDSATAFTLNLRC